MKRLTALILALVLMLSAAPALAAGGEVSYEKIVEAMLDLKALAQGDFLAIKGVPEDVQQRARDWTDAIDDTPDLVIRLNVEESSLVKEYRAMFKSEHEMVSYEAQSTAVGEIVNYAFYMAAMESPDPEKSYSELGDVITALDHRMLYADPDAEDGTMLYVVFYEGGLPIFVLTNVENDAVALTTYFVPSDDLAACNSYVRVVMWFMSWGCPIGGAEVKPE